MIALSLLLRGLVTEGDGTLAVAEETRDLMSYYAASVRERLGAGG